MEQECNGWSNYATWRVSLEFFSDYAPYLLEEGLTAEEVYSRIDHECLQEYVMDLLDGECRCSDSTVLSYAHAFMADVNWHEISAHLEQDLNDNREEQQ